MAAAKPPGKHDAHDKHDAVVVKRGGGKGHDDGHGGAWKVAFADFCLALMCLFLVLWLMAARKQDDIQKVLRAPGGSLMDEGAGHMSDSAGGPKGSLIEREQMTHFGEAQTTEKQDPHAERASAAASASATQGSGGPATASDAKRRYESPSDLQTLAELLEKMSIDAGLQDNLQTVVTGYGLRVMVHDTDREGMFERGSAVPSPRFRGLLQKLGPLFARMDNQMMVVGHTDSAQYGGGQDAYSNWNLSSDRAMASRNLLVGGGMSANSVLQVVGMADRAPMNAKDARASVNRRIELLILTRGQAKTLAAMFGTPGQVEPLAGGVDSAFPDRDALRALRAQVLRPKGGGSGDPS